MATEKRLVDAHEVEELFYKQVEYGATDLMDAFDDALQDAKTVDAVEVVRCKECKHFDEHTKKCYVFCHDCIEVQLEVDSDHFCSYGERRTDG